jgi:hypothetical protein
MILISDRLYDCVGRAFVEDVAEGIAILSSTQVSIAHRRRSLLSKKIFLPDSLDIW